MSKGDKAEEMVQKLLDTLPKDIYTAMQKVIITSETISSEIDHILISSFGIFVIETKSSEGLIIGDTFSSFWTQVIGNRKIRFQNPVRQNWSHVKALQYLFPERPEEHFIPLVVFVGDAELKVKNSTNPVIPLNKMLPIIKLYTKVILGKDEIERIASTLQQYKLTTEQQMINHITFINNKLRERRLKVLQRECPICSSALIVKSDEYGMFMGCSFCDFIVTEK